MARVEQLREKVSELPTEEQVREKAAEGWKLVAVEWRREAVVERREAVVERRKAVAEAAAPAHETPFGLSTAEGETRLEPDGGEQEALRLILELVIDDRNSLAHVADELNRRGLRTRGGESWSQGAVFNMLPRLVEVAPQIFARADWSPDTAVAH